MVGIYTASDRPATTRSGSAAGGCETTPGLSTQLGPCRPPGTLDHHAGGHRAARHQPWYVTVDQALATRPDLTPDEPRPPRRAVRALSRADQHGGLLERAEPRGRQPLPEHGRQLIDRRGVTRSTVEPAVLSLILVALVLLSRLLAAAMTLRRGELALASLRGYGRRQLWFLGMLGAAADPGRSPRRWASCSATSPRGCSPGRWLVPDLPVPFILASALAALGVVLVTGGRGRGRRARRGQRAAQRPDRRRTPSHQGRPGRRRRCGWRWWPWPRPPWSTAASRSHPQKPRRDRPRPADPAGGRRGSARRPAGARGRRAVGAVVGAAPRASRRTSRRGRYAVGTRGRW